MAEKVTQPELKNDAENTAAASPETRARALQIVLDHIKAVDGDRDFLVNKWLVCDRLWRGEPISRYFPSDKTTHVPEPFKQERAVTPRVGMALFPNDDWYRPIPIRPKSANPEAIKALMDQQFRDGRMKSRSKQFLSNCAKYGSAFAKIPWVTDRKKVRMTEPDEKLVYENGVPVDVEPKAPKVKDFELNKDRTEFKNLSIFDFRCDRRYESIHDAPCCSDEFSQTFEDALRKLRAGIYVGVTEAEIKGLVETNSNVPENPGKEQQQQANGAGLQKPEPKNDLRTVDWWGLFDIAGNGERVECQITVLNRQHVVRIAKNNLWHGRRPYLQGKWVPVEGELYGLGVIEPIVHLCLDLNDMQNVLNSGAALASNPMYKVGDTMNVPDEQIVAAPGRVFRGEDISQMQPLHTVDMSQIARVNKGELRDEVSETNGTPRLFMGQMESGQESATGFSGRVREGNIRIKDVAEALADDVFIPFLEMCHFNNQQFLDEEVVVRLTGKAGDYQTFKVNPIELAGIARIQMIMAPQIELLGVRGQQIINFLAIATQNPIVLQMLASKGFDIFEAFKTAWTSEFGYRESERVYPPRADEVMYDQRTENVLLARGIEVDVQPYDNHAAHLQEIMGFEETSHYRRLAEDRKALIQAHKATHDMKLRIKQEQEPPTMPGMPGGAMPGAEEMPGGPGGGMEAPPAPAPTAGIAQGRVLAQTARSAIQGG
jgi:hypothetical protein